MKHNPVVVMKTTLNGSRHIVMPKRRLRIHRASNEIPFFSRNRQRRENAKMPPKKKMKPIAGQQTIAAAFSVPTTSALLPDSDQPRESTSTLPVPTSASPSTEPDEPTAEEVPQPSTCSSQKKANFSEAVAHHIQMAALFR
ncbi:unnamed protein product [Arctogadus glacialis]